MASRIKGITVEIGGDTTKLEQSLKSVNTTIKSTQSELKDVSKLLKLDPSNTELLSQKQKALKEAIGATKDICWVIKPKKVDEEEDFRLHFITAGFMKTPNFQSSKHKRRLLRSLSVCNECLVW